MDIKVGDHFSFKKIIDIIDKDNKIWLYSPKILDIAVYKNLFLEIYSTGNACAKGAVKKSSQKTINKLDIGILNDLKKHLGESYLNELKIPMENIEEFYFLLESNYGLLEERRYIYFLSREFVYRITYINKELEVFERIEKSELEHSYFVYEWDYFDYHSDGCGSISDKKEWGNYYQL